MLSPGHIIFHLISPLVYTSPENLVLFDFVATILEHNLSEIGYEADTAQLSYSLKTEETGLVVKMSGFNHKLPVSLIIMILIIDVNLHQG